MPTTTTTPEKQKTNDYKVADISLADWGRREIYIAEQEMPGLMAIREKYATGQTAPGRAHNRLAPHDNPDRGADRDAGRSRRRACAGRAATFFPPRTTLQPRWPEPACRSSPGKVKALEEYWWCTEPGALFPRAAKARNSSSTMAATSRYSSTKATNSKKAADWVESAIAQSRRTGDQGRCSTKCKAREPVPLARSW